MEKAIILFLSLSTVNLAYTQNSLFKKSIKSVYALYGRHFSTNYVLDSGNSNLIGRKNVVSLEMGLNLDYPINNILKIRTGINGHLLFLSEVDYGISGPLPPGVDFPFTNIYRRGAEYIESVNISVPIKAMYSFLKKGKTVYSVAGGPCISFYFPASNEMAGFETRKYGELIRQHWVTRHFKNYRSNKSIGISYPQLEWDFDVEGTRKLRKYGAISLGLKAHIGTRRLENATFEIWPTEPDYRSKGHFTLNRSYIGIYSAFTFDKNKK